MALLKASSYALLVPMHHGGVLAKVTPIGALGFAGLIGLEVLHLLALCCSAYLFGLYILAQCCLFLLTVGDVIEFYLVEDVEARRKSKGAAEARRMLTQLINFDTWLANERGRRDSQANTSGRKRKNLPKNPVGNVAHLPAEDFTREIAHNLLLAFGTSAPRAAAMARQELRAAWRYAIATGRIPGPISPFERLEGASKDSLGGGNLKPTSRRDRHLSRDEVGLLLRWMAEPRTYSRTVRDALELVLRTGLRSGEVCGIHTRELVRRDGVLWLDIPGERMKMGKPHSVPLMGKAEGVVLARMPAGGGYLFAGKNPAKPILQKVLGVEVYTYSGRSPSPAYEGRRICPVVDWAPHDLRRTVRTLLSEMGCPFEVAEGLMAHSLPGVASIYNRALHETQRVEWLAKLGEVLDTAAKPLAHLSLVGNQA